MAQKMTDTMDEFIETQLEAIDEQIQKIDNSKVMQAAQELIAKRTILVATRRALMGGNAMTGGSSGNRVSREDVVRAMQASELGTGFMVADLAHNVGTTESVIRGHLSRGDGERFFKSGRQWYLRDPEKGFEGPSDLGDDDG